MQRSDQRTSDSKLLHHLEEGTEVASHLDTKGPCGWRWGRETPSRDLCGWMGDQAGSTGCQRVNTWWPRSEAPRASASPRNGMRTGAHWVVVSKAFKVVSEEEPRPLLPRRNPSCKTERRKHKILPVTREEGTLSSGTKIPPLLLEKQIQTLSWLQRLPG